MATRKSKPVRKSASAKRSATSTRRPARRKPQSLRLRTMMPSFTVDNLERSLAFYIEGLGFVVQEEWVDKGVKLGAMLKAGTIEIGIGRDDGKLGKRRKKGQGMRLYFETVQDIDALAERVRAFGGKITDEPKESSWGSYGFSVDDPSGFHLTFFRKTGKS